MAQDKNTSQAQNPNPSQEAQSGQTNEGQGSMSRGQAAGGGAGQSQRSPNQELVRRGGRGPQLMRPFEDFDRMFDSFFPRSFMRHFGLDWPTLDRLMPGMQQQSALPVDVIDHENEIVVRAEVPGCTKEDIDISVDDDMLTIRGASGQEQKEESEDYYCRETSYGEFARLVRLPTEVDPNKAQAKVKNGILEVTLPKAEGSKRRSIKVE